MIPDAISKTKSVLYIRVTASVRKVGITDAPMGHGHSKQSYTYDVGGKKKKKKRRAKRDFAPIISFHFDYEQEGIAGSVCLAMNGTA